MCPEIRRTNAARARWVLACLLPVMAWGCTTPVTSGDDPPQNSAPARQRFEQAYAQIASGEYEPARRTLAGLVDEHQRAGRDRQAAEAMFWLSYCYEKTGQKNRAEVFYQEILRRYPDAPAARLAQRRIDGLDIRRPPEE
jgi:TolA-binding protein